MDSHPPRWPRISQVLITPHPCIHVEAKHKDRFSKKYEFEKPNDKRALDLMNAAAKAVMKEIPDLVLAYGVSDEFSFVLHKDCLLFERRERLD